METTTERNDVENDLQNAQGELKRLKDERSDAVTEREELTIERNENASAFLPAVADASEVTVENLDELRDTVIPELIEETNVDLNDIGNTIAKHRNDEKRYEVELAEIKELGEQDKCSMCGDCRGLAIESEVEELEAAIAAAQESVPVGEDVLDGILAARRT